MTDQSVVQSVEQLTLAPGDLLIVNAQEWLSEATIARIASQLEAVVAKGVKVVVFERGMRAQRLRVQDDALRVGDRTRFSAALLQEIHAMADHESVLVEVDEITRRTNGEAVVVVKAVRD